MFWSLSSLVPFYLARISVEVAKTDKNNYPCSRGLCWLLTRLFRQVEIANLSRPNIKFYEAVIIKCVLGWRRQINVRGGAASFCEAVSGGHPWHGTPGTGGRVKTHLILWTQTKMSVTYCSICMSIDDGKSMCSMLWLVCCVGSNNNPILRTTALHNSTSIMSS